MPDRFRFTHRLTADAAHRALLCSNRRMLHSAAADALLARLVPGTVDEASLRLRLLEHFEQSERWAEAHNCACELIEIWTDKGTSLSSQAMMRRAEAAWSRQQPAGDKVSARLLLARAAVAELSGDYGQVEHLAAAAFAAARCAGDVSIEIRALIRLGINNLVLGAIDDAERQLILALELIESVQDPLLQAQVLGRLADLSKHRSRFSEALSLYEQVLALFRAQGNLRAEAGILMAMALVLNMQGEPRAAQAYTRQALELARQTGNRRLEGWLLGNLANQLNREERIAEALAFQQQALALMQELGDRATHALFLGNLAILYREFGNEAAEREHHELALAEHRRLGAVHPAATVLCNLSDWHLRHGDAQRAQEAAREALAIFTGLGDLLFQGWALSTLATAELALDELDSAEQHYAAGVDCLRGCDESPDLLETLVEWAVARFRQPGMAAAANPSTAALLDEAEVLLRDADEPFASQCAARIAALRTAADAPPAVDNHQ